MQHYQLIDIVRFALMLLPMAYASYLDHAMIRNVIPCSNVSANYTLTVVVNVTRAYKNISQIRLKTRETGNNSAHSELTICLLRTRYGKCLEDYYNCKCKEIDEYILELTVETVPVNENTMLETFPNNSNGLLKVCKENHSTPTRILTSTGSSYYFEIGLSVGGGVIITSMIIIITFTRLNGRQSENIYIEPTNSDKSTSATQEGDTHSYIDVVDISDPDENPYDEITTSSSEPVTATERSSPPSSSQHETNYTAYVEYAGDSTEKSINEEICFDVDNTETNEATCVSTTTV